MQKDDIDGTFLRMIASDTLRTITIRKWPIFLQMDHSRFCATSPPMQSLDNWKIGGGFAILEFLKLSLEPLEFWSLSLFSSARKYILGDYHYGETTARKINESVPCSSAPVSVREATRINKRSNTSNT